MTPADELDVGSVIERYRCCRSCRWSTLGRLYGRLVGMFILANKDMKFHVLVHTASQMSTGFLMLRNAKLRAQWEHHIWSMYMCVQASEQQAEDRGQQRTMRVSTKHSYTPPIASATKCTLVGNGRESQK